MIVRGWQRINHAIRRAYIAEVAEGRRRKIEAWRRAEQIEEDVAAEHLENAAHFGKLADEMEAVYHASLPKEERAGLRLVKP